MTRLNRRDFVGTMVGFTGAALCRPAPAQAPKGAVDLTLRLSVSTWSFRNHFPKTRNPSAAYKAAEIRLPELVRRIKEKFDIRDVELSSAHLESFNSEYLGELRAAVFELGCRFIHLTDHLRGLNIARADRKAREHDLQIYEGLIGAAEQLAIRSLRVDAGVPEGADAEAIAAASIKRLARLAKERKVEIVLENRPGLTAEPKALSRLAAECGDNVSVCPEWAGLPDGEGRFAALGVLLKQARKVCAASFHDLDEDGRQREFDLARCFKALKAAKFSGWIALRYLGPNDPMLPLERALARAREWLK